MGRATVHGVGQTAPPRKRSFVSQLQPIDSIASPEGATKPLVVAGLFAGVGGFELGLARSGHSTGLLCEIEPGAVRTLEAQQKRGNLDQAPIHRDVQTLKGRDLPADISLLTAGFPCQNLSQAGMMEGIAGKKSGLIYEVFRLLRERPVPWLLIENVPFMLHLGGGEALEVIVSELERQKYKWAYRVVDSRAFGLAHRRRRVYLLASLVGDPRDVLLSGGSQPNRDGKQDRTGWVPAARADDFSEWGVDRSSGFYWTEGNGGLGWAFDAIPTLKGGSGWGIPSAPAVVTPDGHLGRLAIEHAEQLQGFPIGWTQPTEEVTRPGHRWKLTGNAVSVPAATWIGDRLLAPETYEGGGDPPFVRQGSWPKAAWNIGAGRHDASGSVSEFPESSTHEVGDAASLETLVGGRSLEPLSVKATAGFYSRAMNSRLRFPPGFLGVVRRNMEGGVYMPKSKRPKPSSSTGTERLNPKRLLAMKPEETVAALLRELAGDSQYRRNAGDLPGAPEFVGAGWVVFVHGCHWHRHEDCKRATIPKAKREWWMEQFERTRTLDLQKVDEIKRTGLRVEVVWECDLEQAESLKRRLASLVRPDRGFAHTPRSGELSPTSPAP